MPQFYYDHDHLYSPDPQKTVEWYMRVFGAKKTGETKTPRMNLIHMDINGAHLIVAGPFQGEFARAKQTEQYVGLDHFGFKTENLEEAIKDLKAKGVKFLQDLTVTPSGGKIAFLEAPDNVRIELTERP